MRLRGRIAAIVRRLASSLPANLPSMVHHAEQGLRSGRMVVALRATTMEVT
jgi:hypothetical protein